MTPTGANAPIGAIRTWVDPDRTAGTTYFYRVFAEHNKRVSDAGGTDEAADEIEVWTEASLPASVTTAPAGMPDEPISFGVLAVSETQIDLSWAAPGDEGSEPVGYGKVVGYEIEVSDDGKTFSLLETVKADKNSYSHEGLVQGQTQYYRVSTINNAPGSAKRSVPTAVMKDTTYRSLASDNPGGLIAKAAGRSSIELVWNARADDITAAPIIGYKIESSPLNAAGDDCAEDWSVLESNTMSTTTSYTHMGLMAATGVCYRVFGINEVATSSGFVGYGDDYVTTNDNDAIATTGPAVAPMMPTAVTAAVVDDMQINVSWMAPADDGGSDILGYVLQRKSDGDYMTIAASNAASWWNALDCPMMNDAIPADATPPPGADDSSSPYCKLYDYLAEDAKEEVDAAYMALGHGTISDTSYMNVGLMDMTAYTYRVKAVNAKGASGWAESNTATTDTSVTVPSIVLNVAATATSDTEIMVTWDPPADDGGSPITSYMIIYRVDGADESTNMEMEETGSSTTISGLMANTTYRVWVTATNAIGDGDGKGQTTVTTQMAPVELTMPTNIQANPQGSGLVSVSWGKAVDGASGYTIIAINVEDVNDYETKILDDETETSTQIALTAGKIYNVYVGSFSGQEFKLNTDEKKRVEVE